MKKHLRDIVATLAQDVRYWAEGKAGEGYDDLNGWCAKCSAKLHHRLRDAGIESKIHMSSNEWGSHVYLVVDDHIVDVTATQFGRFPAVMIKHQKEMDEHEFFQTTDTFNSVNELREFQKKNKWPTSQIAYSH
jgi:hypothetical protein